MRRGAGGVGEGGLLRGRCSPGNSAPDSWSRGPARRVGGDLGTDLREQADLAPDEPELLAELRAAWEKVDSTLLPYPD
ncbi:hypothetical protein [Streptomyces sp. NPDC093591]|uniref:hypothetical protein n=1 Tax=Streptomyces sp. NPDC093591 TaxID=3366044 RepID=UPI0038010180